MGRVGQVGQVGIDERGIALSDPEVRDVAQSSHFDRVEACGRSFRQAVSAFVQSVSGDRAIRVGVSVEAFGLFGGREHCRRICQPGGEGAFEFLEHLDQNVCRPQQKSLEPW
jgi:hypothetical protein